MIGEAGRDKQAENNAGRRDEKACERRHDGAARASDVAVAQCAEETESRRPAYALAEERQLSTEIRLRLDAASSKAREGARAETAREIRNSCSASRAGN